jgi:biopolymer transport protein ExbD
MAAQVKPQEEEQPRRSNVNMFKRKGSSMRNPPLTPLIDVFLFLIIFFLLACQFHAAEGTIPANLPALGKGNADEQNATKMLEQMVVRLTPIGDQGQAVQIEAGIAGFQECSDMEALYGALRQARSHYGEDMSDQLPVVIKPIRGVRWGFVVDAFNQAVRGGYKEVGVAPSTSAR